MPGWTCARGTLVDQGPTKAALPPAVLRELPEGPWREPHDYLLLDPQGALLNDFHAFSMSFDEDHVWTVFAVVGGEFRERTLVRHPETADRLDRTERVLLSDLKPAALPAAGSPRYLAEHVLLPRFLRERGAAETLSAFQRGDRDYFLPVWTEAGFRFLPQLEFGEINGLRFGLMTLPVPREAAEAYFGAVVGKASDPAFLRYFLWERGDAGTFVGEWQGTTHLNHGAGAAFTGNFEEDGVEFLQRVTAIVGLAPAGRCGECRHANQGTEDAQEGLLACPWLGGDRTDKMCEIAFEDTGAFCFEPFTGSNGTWGSGGSPLRSPPAGYEHRKVIPASGPG